MPPDRPPPQALPVSIIKPLVVACKQLPEVRFWPVRVLAVVLPTLLTVKYVSLEDEAARNISKAGWVVVPWTTMVAIGVVELIATLPAGVTVKMTAPVEVFI